MRKILPAASAAIAPAIAHTQDHLNCPACRAAGEEVMQIPIAPYLRFEVAAQQWLATFRFQSRNPTRRIGYIAERTLHDYEYYLGTLNGFFARLPLEQITVGHIRSYQQERSAKVGANKINSETQILRRVLRWAQVWHEEMENAFQLLNSDRPDIPRAMTPEEQQRFLALASSREEWQLVWWFSLAALKTTMSNCEMTGLKVGDIQLMHPEIVQVRERHAKNKYRVRTIGLDEQAVWAFRQILDRAARLGAIAREHYAFPFREKRNTWNPLRPMTNSGIKKPFDALRREAGVPWLRIHDLRHTAITRLAEAGTPMPIIMSMAGHITQRMMQHYTHIGHQAQRHAQEKAAGIAHPVVTIAPPAALATVPRSRSRTPKAIASSAVNVAIKWAQR